MEKSEYKYNCEKCNFKCNTKARWDAHINTILHKTGIKKKRSDYKEPYKCDKCDFISKNLTVYKVHILNNHSTIEERKQGYKIYCQSCDFGSFYEVSMNTHNKSIKHKYNIIKNNILI